MPAHTQKRRKIQHQHHFLTQKMDGNVQGGDEEQEEGGEREQDEFLTPNDSARDSDQNTSEDHGKEEEDLDEEEEEEEEEGDTRLGGSPTISSGSRPGPPHNLSFRRPRQGQSLVTPSGLVTPARDATTSAGGGGGLCTPSLISPPNNHNPPDRSPSSSSERNPPAPTSGTLLAAASRPLVRGDTLDDDAQFPGILNSGSLPPAAREQLQEGSFTSPTSYSDLSPGFSISFTPTNIITSTAPETTPRRTLKPQGEASKSSVAPSPFHSFQADTSIDDPSFE